MAKPQIGQQVSIPERGIEGKIVRIHGAGTIDLEDAKTGNWYRISGLPAND